MTRPGRDAMVPSDSGRPYQPGQDCPNCGQRFVTTDDGHKLCQGCGTKGAVR